MSHTFELFGHSPLLVRLETQYLQIVLCMCLFKMIGTAAGQFLLATNRPNCVLISAVIAVGVNALAACGLVLGKFGVTPHGVAGSAWAQNIGVFTEMCVLLCFAFARRSREIFHSLDWRLRMDEFRVLLVTGSGSGRNKSSPMCWPWSLLLVNLVIGHLGEKVMAANQLMFRYMAMSFMPALGVGQAVTALVGRYIGAGRPDIAMRRAHLGFVVTAIYMLTCATIYVLGRRELIQILLPDPEVVRIGATLMIFAAAYQFFDAMYVVYNGALRGAGDTLMPAVATAGLNWGISVGGGWLIVRFLPQTGVVGPWVAALLYGIILSLLSDAAIHPGRLAIRFTWSQTRIRRCLPLHSIFNRQQKNEHRNGTKKILQGNAEPSADGVPHGSEARGQ